MPVVARLAHRVGIILPSRDRHGLLLTQRRREGMRQMVAEWFSRSFPGSTEDRMQIRPRLRGRWGEGAGITVEDVEEIWTYCSAADFRKHRLGLIHLAEQVVLEGNQEAVALLVGSGMEIVVGKETS